MSPAAPSPDLPAASPLPYKDRSTGLMVFGILEVLFGLLCLLLAGLMVFSQAMLLQNAQGGVTPRGLLPAILVYVVMAVAFFWLGIGSMLRRRWARSLLIILGWAWLSLGLLSVPTTVWMTSRMLSTGKMGTQALPAGALTLIITFQIGFMLLFLVVVPVALLVFYHSRHVLETCLRSDPTPRWTDACPLPLLGMACLNTVGSVGLLAMVAAGFGIFPLFGILVTGVPGGILMALTSGFILWIGWSWYRMRMSGWWGMLILTLGSSISSGITFLRVDLIALYRTLGYPQQQIDMIRDQGLASGGFMLWNTAIWQVAMLLYLLWARRFFPKS